MPRVAHRVASFSRAWKRSGHLVFLQAHRVHTWTQWTRCMAFYRNPNALLPPLQIAVLFFKALLFFSHPSIHIYMGQSWDAMDDWLALEDGCVCVRRPACCLCVCLSACTWVYLCLYTSLGDCFLYRIKMRDCSEASVMKGVLHGVHLTSSWIPTLIYNHNDTLGLIGLLRSITCVLLSWAYGAMTGNAACTYE